MSTSRHTCQIAHNALGRYVSVGLEDPEAPHQFPLQPPNLPTAPTPIEANTFIHIPDSPTLSPSPFQYLTFNSYPQHYASDSSKVFFTISYLKKSVLEWFEIGGIVL